MTETYKTLLSQFIQFKTISTSEAFKSDIDDCVIWLKETFQKKDFTIETVYNYGNPIIIATYNKIPNAPTCLIYGHYDVQPAEFEEGWNTKPFELHEKNNRIYARGAIDNKGQVMVHIATIFDLITENKLSYNIVLLLEGNEETGSPLLSNFIEDYKDILKSDVILISDGEITGENPVLELGFRGGFNSTLSIKTANNDLHSGIYGGAAPSASHEMTKILATLFKENNQIAIEGFYDSVLPIDGKMNVPFNQEEYEKITGCKTTLTEPDIDFYNQTGLRPTLQITGINTGYTDEGYRNGIPATAIAKINARLVKNQDPKEIAQLLHQHFKKVIPSYVDFTFEYTDPYDGIKLDINNDYVKNAATLLEKSFNKPVLYKYSGGGLPVVTKFNEILQVPQILAPLANEDCNMHGVNENFKLDTLEKALNFSKKFFSKA